MAFVCKTIFSFSILRCSPKAQVIRDCVAQDPPSSEISATAVSLKGVPSSLPIAPAQSSGVGQALVARKSTELSWGQKLLGFGAFVAAGAGAGVITKVCTACFD